MVVCGSRSAASVADVGASCPLTTCRAAGGAAVRDRDAGRLRNRHDARDAGNDVDRNAGSQAGRDLFAAAAVDERVAALQAHDAEPAACAIDQDRVDLMPAARGGSGALADVDDLDLGGEFADHAGRSEPIGDDDVRLGEQRGARAR